MSEKESINPYTAPSADEPPEALRGGLWQVSGKLLLFRDGARLPRLDLYSGEEDLPLTPASSEFSVAMGWRQFFWLPIVLVGLMTVGHSAQRAIWVMPVVALVGILAALLLGSRGMQKARLHWFVSAAAEDRRRGRNKLGTLLILGGIAFLIGTMLYGSFEWQVSGIGLMVVLLLLFLVLQRLGPRFSCHRAREGWFEVRGIPAKALGVLAARQGDAMRELLEAPAEKRVCRVYKCYAYRLSLGQLMGKNWWNPFLFISVLAMKLKRSPRLVRDCLHWAEATELDESEWDPLLRERWELLRELDAFRGWQLNTSRQLDSQAGDSLTQWLVGVSPDDLHSVTVAVVRIANARASAELQETSFRSWDSDGTIWLTSNLEFLKPLPPNLRASRSKGSIGSVLEDHLAKVASLPLLPAGGAEAWKRRTEEDMESRHRALEESGFYGPTREEELEIRD